MKVSICIPTYNQVKYLKKTLDSILIQSFQDFEILVSDDSTLNDVEDLIQTYKQKDDRIIYYRNSPSLGSPENWNYVVSQATGKYIKIMHHDDWFVENDALQKLVDVCDQNPNSLVFAGIKGEIVHEKRFYVNRPSKDKITNIINEPFNLIWANYIGPPSTILFPRVSLKFDKNLIWLVDIEFYLNLMLHFNFKLVYLDEVLFENITDDHNITNDCFQNKQLELKEFNYIYNKYYPHSSWRHKFLFLKKLKKHISTYATVSWVELIKSNIQNQTK